MKTNKQKSPSFVVHHSYLKLQIKNTLPMHCVYNTTYGSSKIKDRVIMAYDLNLDIDFILKTSKPL